MAHHFTRAPLTAVLAALVAAAPLGAQWQGVVTFHNTERGSQQDSSDIQYLEGPGGVSKMIMQDREGGPISMIFNRSQNTATIVMASRQMYMTMPMDQAQAEAKKQMSKLKITDTGRSDVVAGHKCEVFHTVDPEQGSQSDACIATDMGTFMMFDAPGSQGRGGGAASALSMVQSLFGAKGGFFPLKVTTYKDGKVENAFVATSIQAKSIEASEFVPPSSYKPMSMPGRP